ncbi:hypothetical protein GOP47_0010239 [Adiantum capillus-veneris]|uniref:non-specific serine/threonine protein kinase n=1 Tax=Adiantum capillus-veneris TaxID=13818 RepID=A0A9D4UUD1_ADICA|nr:hypothetical protein GOP47_0010239 [Adiantum capillus-veneris]
MEDHSSVSCSTVFRLTYYTKISFVLAGIALLQATLLWSSATSQRPGFLSIDCASNTEQYTDHYGINWVPDTNLTNEGRKIELSNSAHRVLKTMRLFDDDDGGSGSSSAMKKYCYRLSTADVHAGAFFLVRVGMWAGIAPPHMPKGDDNLFRFKLMVDADTWREVEVSYGDRFDWSVYEAYVRAQRNSIDVCLARSSPDGDVPFISSLELRPLPPSLTSISLINATNRFLILHRRRTYVPLTGPSLTRYSSSDPASSDSLDRIWNSKTVSNSSLNTTESAIDVTSQHDELPANILQNTVTTGSSFNLNYSSLQKLYTTNTYFAEFYFAEINPSVIASGLRELNILANGELLNKDGPIDVFAAVGANTAYAFSTIIQSPNATDQLNFTLIPTTSAIFPPFLGAFELFNTKPITPLTDATIVGGIEKIKTSLGLSTRYRGDPCLPIGYGYSWVNCSMASGITALLLSNYNTGGKISTAINSLTMLTEIRLNGNGLQGEIPDMSALANLKILDLSNNKLSGSIPNFLATLKNLKLLNLQNNDLSGEIPAALLLRKQASVLEFEYSGNSHLCESTDEECLSSLSSPSKKSSTRIIIGVIIAVVVLVSFAIGLLVVCRFHKKKPSKKKPIGRPCTGNNRVIPKLCVQEFSFDEIRDATNNFCTKLGQGGFGPVYKGCLQDGRQVAIKVAYDFSHQGPKEFLNEVDLLSRVHHRNLVALIGYCNEEKLILVYEFMSNGSLFDCLHGPSLKAAPLSWATRLQILVDAAEGLEYLHRSCNPPIIHRDIKSSNLLLNDKMEAKLSDFGISRKNMMGGSESLNTPLMGTMGYMDPEYFSGERLTEKVDVYSFGVLVFEVICGQRAVFQESWSPEQKNLVEWAKAFIDRGAIDDIVDVSLNGQYDVRSVRKAVEVAVACVGIPSPNRPKMTDVCMELREAERLELETGKRIAIGQPTVKFAGGDNNSTYLIAR